MSRITLDNIAHSYLPNPRGEGDYALKRIDTVWDDGGAYALLGPSGVRQDHPAEHHFRTAHTQRGPGSL